MKKLPCFALCVLMFLFGVVVEVGGKNWEEEFLEILNGESDEFPEGIYFVEISNEMRPVDGGKRDKEPRKGMPSVVGGSERPYLFPGESIVREYETVQEFITAVTLGLGKLTDMYHPGVMEKQMAKRYVKDYGVDGPVGSLKIPSFHKLKFKDKVLLDKGESPKKLRDAYKAVAEFCLVEGCDVEKFLDQAVVECEYDDDGSMVCFGIEEGSDEEEGEGESLVMDSGGGVTDMKDVGFFSLVYEDWDGKKMHKGKSRRRKH